MSDQIINARITADTAQAEQGIRTISRSISDLGSQSSKSAETSNRAWLDAFSGIGQGWAQMATAFTAGNIITKALDVVIDKMSQLKEAVKDAILMSARYETLGVVMKVVGANAGYTASQMAVFQAGLQKTGISAIEARQGLMLMGQANVDMANSSKLARIAQDAAVIGNINSSEAFNRMMTGLATGQSILMHHLGLMTNFETAYLNAAHAAGKTTNDLTEVEKAQIRVNEVLRAGVGISGSYEAAMGTAGKQLNSMKRYIDDLKVQFGEMFQGALIAGVTAFSNSLKYVSGHFEEIKIAAMAVASLLAGAAMYAAAPMMLALAGTVGMVLMAVNGFAYALITADGAAIAATFSFNALKVAMATNPLGLIIAALTVAAGLWMTYIKVQSDAIDRNAPKDNPVLVNLREEVTLLQSKIDLIKKSKGLESVTDPQVLELKRLEMQKQFIKDQDASPWADGRVAGTEIERQNIEKLIPKVAALKKEYGELAHAASKVSGDKSSEAAKLTDAQKGYQHQIKEFLKTAWDAAALELAAEDFSSDVTKKMGLLNPKPAGFTKNPALSLGVDIQIQSLAQQEAATKKLAEAETARLAGLREEYRIQREIDALDKDNARLAADLIDDPYLRQAAQMKSFYDAERAEIKRNMELKETTAEGRAKLVKKLGLIEANETNATTTNTDNAFKAQLGMAANYASIGGELFSALASAQDQSTRSGFESAKAYSLGAAIMSTAAAVMGQLSGPDAWTPIAWARAAMAGVLGAIQVATIASTSFGGGGSVNPSVPSGSFGGAAQSSVGGSIGAPTQSVKDSQSQTDLQRIAGAMENASLAIGKVADGLTKISDLFTSGSFLSLASSAAPGMGGQVGKAGLKTEWAAMMGFSKEALIGSLAGPYGLIIGGLVGAATGLFNATFGMGAKTNEAQGLTLGLSGKDIESQTYTDWKQKGGWFRSDKKGTNYGPGNSDFTEVMQAAINQILSTISRSAVATGTIANFGQASLAPSKIATAGRTPDAIAKDLEAWLVTASNALAKTVVGLQDFAFYGENAFDALVRLSTALQSTNEGLSLIGANLITSTLSGANAAWKLQDMMGGAEKFTTAVDTYFTSMFTDQEQAAKTATQAQRQVTVAFAEMGIAVPATKEEFKNLVNSMDLTTASGASTFAALMDVTTAFATVQDQITKLAETTATFSNDLTVREMTLAGLVGGVDLFTLRIKQEQEMKQAQLDGMDTNRLAIVQSQEWSEAVAKATGVVADSITKIIDAAKKAVTDMIDAQINIANAMKTIMTGPLAGLSPQALYNQAQAKFAALQGKTDLASLQALPQAATDLLNASKAYNASGSAYQTDLANVLAAMNGAIGGTGDPTLDTIESQLKVLQDIRTALTSGALVTELGATGTLAGLIGTWNAATAAQLQKEKEAAAAETLITLNASIAAVKAEQDKLIMQTTSGVRADFLINAAQGSYDWAQVQIDNGVMVDFYKQQQVGDLLALSEAKAMKAALLATWDRSTLSSTELTRLTTSMTSLAATMQALITSYTNPTGTAPYMPPLPAFALGGIAYSASIFGEAGPEAAVPLPDGRRIPVMLSGSADNKETVAELKEQNALLRALLAETKTGVRVAQAVGEETIAIGKKQAMNGERLANSTRLAANS